MNFQLKDQRIILTALVLISSSLYISSAFADDDYYQQYDMQNAANSNSQFHHLKIHLNHQGNLQSNQYQNNPQGYPSGNNVQQNNLAQHNPDTMSQNTSPQSVSVNTGATLQSGSNAALISYDKILSGITSSIFRPQTLSSKILTEIPSLLSPTDNSNHTSLQNPENQRTSNQENTDTINPAKLDLVLWVTILAVSSIVIHAAAKAYKTRKRFAVKKMVQ